MAQNREHFGSRLGFILMTAGCAIGLGNVWRFPYIAGKYGGGLFVLLYLFFLLVLGFPVLMMELAVGRAGQSTFPGAFRKLQNPGTKYQWHLPVYLLFAGNLILLMFYTAITGWLVAYSSFYLTGRGGEVSAATFDTFLASPGQQSVFMLGSLLFTVLICMGGVQKTIEKSIKVMMGGLVILLGILVFHAVRLPGAGKGLRFFLCPDIAAFTPGLFLEAVHAAMAQAFFTLSLGIGSIAICGSYFDRKRSLPQEGFWIAALDTSVAFCSGLIIFPCCAAFNVNPAGGPPLIFITLPQVFKSMPGGFFWGALFFIFLSVAAISTLIAVFENLVAFGMDEFGWKRRKSCVVFGVALALLSMPCILGFNLWKNFQPFGAGSSVLDLEDFIVSDNLLPLGALYLSIFCLTKSGWGRDNLRTELNTGTGWKLPAWFVNVLRWYLPVLIFAIWLIGILKKFALI
ncbi:MAG: sodium-dependent transporter [Lentisphaerae bacterium]|nr:sodium-dependent transporter [Lentisphaerota bacterium]